MARADHKGRLWASNGMNKDKYAYLFADLLSCYWSWLVIYMSSTLYSLVEYDCSMT